MLRKILSSLGLGGEQPAAPPAAIPSSHDMRIRPYRDESCNFIYSLLFCDDQALFAKPDGEPWTTVLGDAPDPAALRAIAMDESQEGRVRMLAFNRLRELGEAVPERILLGVVIEVGMDGGLDALAAFADGGVRYINHTEKMSIFEGDLFPQHVGALLAASRTAVEQIGPWTEARLPPPSAGMVRMTFLVSDGLYFGQGAMDVIMADSIGGPVMAAGGQLLQVVVDTALQQQGGG